MATIYVGVGEYAATKSREDVIKTLALGSCVGVILLDPIARVAGLLHVALPDSSISRKRVEERPGMFADTGIPCILKEMQKLGSALNAKMLVKLAGGARIMDPNNTFNIGKRNILAVKKILWKYKLGARSEDLGGTISRTVSVYLDNGKTTISSPGRGEWEL